MSFVYILSLAIIQGLTEFLPVSSSAHLALLPSLSNQPDQGLLIDVAVHVGTLVAVMIYLRGEVLTLVRGVLDIFCARWGTAPARLAFALALATVPVVVVGFVFYITGTSEALRSPKIIAWAMIGFGVLLYIFDRRGEPMGSGSSENSEIKNWSLIAAIKVGLWQACALIPGASRSGVCITGLRALGYSRAAALRIAMLMSIPTIIASGVLLGGDAIRVADSEALIPATLAAFISCIAALIALMAMTRFLRFASFTPYVIYRVILGVALLVWF